MLTMTSSTASAETDETHDIGRSSWVTSAREHAEFPLQNLPFGIFSDAQEGRRGGIAIGDEIFDLNAGLKAGLFSGDEKLAAEAAAGPVLNDLMMLGPGPRRALRRRLFELLAAGAAQERKVASLAPMLLRTAAACTLHLPARVGDYTDFFAGIHHATNSGRISRAPKALAANYKHLPIAYHGRASSIRLCNQPVRRPSGQRFSTESGPVFGPSLRLDYELELGAWIGPGNPLGEPIDISSAGEHLFGFCLLNDWSARDIQGWEMQPLGPFIAKNFATSISPWVVTMEALAPFRIAQAARPESDPRPLPYLWNEADQACGAFDIQLDVLLSTPAFAKQALPPQRVSHASARELYWTFAQMVAHHTCGGCDLNAGDLLGSGTVSGQNPESFGSLFELTDNGKRPIALVTGEQRGYLQDGDQVIFRARCAREGFVSIGFGDCLFTVAR